MSQLSARKKTRLISPAFGAFFVGLFLFLSPMRVGVAENLKTESEALAVAQTLETLIIASWEKYTEMVVKKLIKDGLGASEIFDVVPGHAPLAFRLLQEVAQHVGPQQAANEGKPLFSFALRSGWYSGFKESFDKEGWEFLTSQQDTWVKARKALRTLEWKPYSKIEEQDGNKVFRYFAPITATSNQCVKCHNQHEKLDEVKKIRRLTGLPSGKKFKKHELIGGLLIDIPLNQE